MRVILAGHNVDIALLDQARAALGPAAEQLTPETLSAAYARISRNPAPVDELRQQAREEVARARASNEQIVFGLGHASVAEHAVFNFDLIGLSRLAIEEVERCRLCSYTEKSQRYIRLEDDHVLPREIEQLGLQEELQQLVAQQNQLYHQLYHQLRDHIFASHPEEAAHRRHQRTLEGWAKEDARYVTALATEGQLGMTLNARNLEHMVRRLLAHPLHEVRQIGDQLYRQAHGVAPSLVRYVETTDEQRRAASYMRRLVAKLIGGQGQGTLPGATGAVQLVAHTPEPDIQTAAALLHAESCAPWTECNALARSMGERRRAQLIRSALAGLGPHDSVPRALEGVSFTLDVVASAACFGQLKRHRMASLLSQPYDPALGYTVPAAVQKVGLVREVQQLMMHTTRLYERLADRDPHAAAYVLTQAHRRRVLLTMNARELYHFARLRQDAHAQWDIRALADRVVYLCRQQAPLTLMLCCGKDRFDEQCQQVYGDKTP